MTFSISNEMFVILIIGSLVGYAVFRHNARTATGMANRGDLAGGLTTAFTVIAGLVLVFGLAGGPDSNTSSTPSPQPASTEFRQ
jgi:hypothetical protein|uniref:hypothetical protein n=1 Tax=Streptomyces sp. MSC1_001 TaxID=2909263 RepID=UPI00202F45BD|nr:hypothetical protein [Streptomyces sp. MSC1_001]